MIRRNRKLFVHLLSLTLLFAQFGMVVHASTHLKTDGHAIPSQAQLCGECLSFAPIHNAVGGSPPVVLVIKTPAQRIHEVVGIEAVPPRTFDAFRSRAPPVLH